MADKSEVSVTGVVFESQTYRNLSYLMLSFFLGIGYLVFLVTGLSVGFGLTVVWIGIPILLLVSAGWWKLAAFERGLAGSLLATHIPPPPPKRQGLSLVRRFTGHFGNSLTWKSLLFLLLKFPLGIVSFVLVVTLSATSLSLIAVPFAYRFVDITIGPYDIDAPLKAIYLGGLGCFIGVWSLHGLNAWSRLCGKLATKLLSPSSSSVSGAASADAASRSQFARAMQDLPIARSQVAAGS